MFAWGLVCGMAAVILALVVTVIFWNVEPWDEDADEFTHKDRERFEQLATSLRAQSNRIDLLMMYNDYQNKDWEDHAREGIRC